MIKECNIYHLCVPQSTLPTWSHAEQWRAWTHRAHPGHGFVFLLLMTPCTTSAKLAGASGRPTIAFFFGFLESMSFGSGLVYKLWAKIQWNPKWKIVNILSRDKRQLHLNMSLTLQWAGNTCSGKFAAVVGWKVSEAHESITSEARVPVVRCEKETSYVQNQNSSNSGVPGGGVCVPIDDLDCFDDTLDEVFFDDAFNDLERDRDWVNRPPIL